jgi:hypothetical protein
MENEEYYWLDYRKALKSTRWSLLFTTRQPCSSGSLHSFFSLFRFLFLFFNLLSHSRVAFASQSQQINATTSQPLSVSTSQFSALYTPTIAIARKNINKTTPNPNLPISHSWFYLISVKPYLSLSLIDKKKNGSFSASQRG